MDRIEQRIIEIIDSNREKLIAFAREGYHTAEGSFEEGFKGRIAPGYLADFVVLDGNPFETDPNSLKDIPVHATYLSGNCVFKA